MSTPLVLASGSEIRAQLLRNAGLTIEGDAPEPALTAIAIQTATPPAGRMETGHPMVNRLLSNIEWGQRGNFLAVPTDCPQRDERYGWTADAQVFWRTAGYVADVSAFLTAFNGGDLEEAGVEGAVQGRVGD